MFIRCCPAGSAMDSCEETSCDETPVRRASDCKVGTIACEIDAAVYSLPFTGVNGSDCGLEGNTNGSNPQSCNDLRSGPAAYAPAASGLCTVSLVTAIS